MIKYLKKRKSIDVNVFERYNICNEDKIFCSYKGSHILFRETRRIVR